MALALQPVTSITSTIPVVSSSHSSSSSVRTSRPMTAKSNRTLNTNFVVDWNNPSTANKTKTNEDNNLQEAFRQFREQRMVC